MLLTPARRPPKRAQDDGRERYVFFSFPHTAISATGDVGVISRPNRPGDSCACGALAKVGGGARTLPARAATRARWALHTHAYLRLPLPAAASCSAWIATPSTLILSHL